MQESYSTLSLRVAGAVKKLIVDNPSACLGLPTGRTPAGCYRLLSGWSQDGRLDWRQVKCFALDEYIDAPERASFKSYLERNLYGNTNLPATSRFCPALVDNYDELIALHGGLDLTILGIGGNGHIAFNEPGTPLHSWTHGIFLAEATRQANAEFFDRKESIPTRAVTMGIQTILTSRKIILIASGAQKRDILVRALEGRVTPEVPASFLQLHANVEVITDFDLC